MNLGRIGRKCLEPGGFFYEFRKGAGITTAPLPPEVAYTVKESAGRLGMYADGEPKYRQVTWAEVMAERRERQAERLAALREVRERRAVQVRVRYCHRHLLYRASVVAAGGERGFVHEYNRHDTGQLMGWIPLMRPGAPLFECADAKEWMLAFLAAYPAGKFKGVRCGAVNGWAVCRGQRIDEIIL